MKIAIVSDYYYPSLGGITEHVHNQAMQFAAQGHDVTVITGRPAAVPTISDAGRRRPRPPFTVRYAGTALPLFGNGGQTLHTVGVRLAHRLGRFFRAQRFDVVHVHAPHNPRMPGWAIDQVPADTLAVGTFHTVFPLTGTRRAQALLLRRSIARLDGRICVSSACIGALRPIYPFHYDVIPNGVDTQTFRPRAATERHRSLHTITFLGRFDPRNRLDSLMRAFGLLRLKRRDVELLIIGNGPLAPRLRRLVAPTDRGATYWAGRLDLTRAIRLAGSTLLCTPCGRASFGLVTLEGMSCGLPVLATANSGSTGLIEDGVTGVLLSGDAGPHELAAALDRLLDDPHARSTLGGNARQHAEAHYDWRVIGMRLLTYYERHLRGSASVGTSVPRPVVRD